MNSNRFDSRVRVYHGMIRMFVPVHFPRDIHQVVARLVDPSRVATDLCAYVSMLLSRTVYRCFHFNG